MKNINPHIPPYQANFAFLRSPVERTIEESEKKKNKKKTKQKPFNLINKQSSRISYDCKTKRNLHDLRANVIPIGLLTIAYRWNTSFEFVSMVKIFLTVFASFAERT